MLKVKSFSAVARKYYKQKMAAFLNVKVKKSVNGKVVSVGFTKDGNKHLYADTFMRGRAIDKADLLDMPKLLEMSEYVKSSPNDGNKVHMGNRNITTFHYFKTRLHGNDVYLNVAEETSISGHSQTKRHFLYSVTKHIK